MILRPYPGTEHIHPVQMQVNLLWDDPRLILSFELQGDLDRFESLRAIEGSAKGERKNELWLSTCFECFLKREDGEPYLELNFSPEGHWAAYSFETYRSGMRSPSLVNPPVVSAQSRKNFFRIEASVDLRGTDFSEGPLLASPSAILKDRSGESSYWALVHSQSKPDFHHPQQFTLKLSSKDTL